MTPTSLNDDHAVDSLASALATASAADAMAEQSAQADPALRATFLDRLAAAADAQPEIAELHRALVEVKGSGRPPSLVIGVVGNGPDGVPASVLGVVARAAGPEASVIDLTTAGPGDPTAARMREAAQPSHRRAR